MDEQSIPIDIHYNKLLDWLLDRRISDQQWPSKVLKVREVINAALQDMPEHTEITQLLTGTYINYFHCKRIVDILKETEANSKNMFGMYSSQRMKDWKEIMQLYEKNNVYLAEAAQLLSRTVNSEIPSLKKQMTKAAQLQKDFLKKAGEYETGAAELKEKYHSQCRNLGIEGKKVKSEMLSLADDLPKMYQQAAVKSQDLKGAVEFYTQFVVFSLDKESVGDTCLPILKLIIKKGDVTVYEWKNGMPPMSIQPPKRDFIIEDEDNENESKQDEIDWGAVQPTDLQGNGEEGIDFGNEIPDIIDWGASDEIQVVDELELVSAPTPNNPDDAVGSEALTILDNPQTRNQFLNELLELETFLSQRLVEMVSDGHVLTDAIFHNAPPSMQCSPGEIQLMINCSSSIREEFLTNHVQELLLIRNSPRFVFKCAERLKKLLTDSEKMMSMSRLMKKRQEEAVELHQELAPKLQLVRLKMKELQAQIQTDISARYNSRPVYIMGEINTV